MVYTCTCVIKLAHAVLGFCHALLGRFLTPIYHAVGIGIVRLGGNFTQKSLRVFVALFSLDLDVVVIAMTYNWHEQRHNYPIQLGTGRFWYKI
ncbi:MAG: hypothetical protein Q3971_01540 [Moraxella sp.]|nr:hypothetical protein [Moraxella sp.]